MWLLFRVDKVQIELVLENFDIAIRVRPKIRISENSVLKTEDDVIRHELEPKKNCEISSVFIFVTI